MGGSTPWIAITAADVRRVWRTLAHEYVKTGRARGACGARQTEVAIDALYSIATWLREEEAIPADALPPIVKWRSKLKAEWESIVGQPVQPSRPRHSEAEMRQLFAHMHDENVDPRFALAFDLGGEQRIGQVLRSRRLQLDLPALRPNGSQADCIPSTRAFPGHLGSLRILGSGKKKAMPVLLSSEQRHNIDRALAGYLAEYERRWQAGEIEDYPLFPNGRLKRGKARVVAEPKRLTRDAALKMFHELERIAGVAPVLGRGWYGVRRVAADFAEDFEKDERVLNAMTGHRDSATRRDVYQAPERSSVLRQVTALRNKVRKADPSTAVA